MNYNHWYDNPYNWSIAPGVFGIGFVLAGLGLEKIVDKNMSENLIFLGVGLGILSGVGLCLGYLIDWEDNNIKKIH